MILIKVCKPIIQHDRWRKVRGNSKPNLTDILCESKDTLRLDGLPLGFCCGGGIGAGEGGGHEFGGDDTEITSACILCAVRIVNTNLLHLNISQLGPKSHGAVCMQCTAPGFLDFGFLSFLLLSLLPASLALSMSLSLFLRLLKTIVVDGRDATRTVEGRHGGKRS